MDTIKSKKLSNLIKLSCSVKLLIPSTQNVDVEISDQEFEIEVENALVFLGNLFGGSTGSDAVGTWVSSSGLVKEKVKSIESFCSSDDLNKYIDDVIDYSILLKKRMNQEAIALTVNNELYFV